MSNLILPEDAGLIAPPRTEPTRRIALPVAQLINMLVAGTHQANKHWWRDPATGEQCDADPLVPQKLMLIVSELSEAMEGHRKSLQDDKLPHRTAFEVELADALIRLLDLAGAMGLDLGGAFEEKMAYNSRREDHTDAARLAEGGKRY